MAVVSAGEVDGEVVDTSGTRYWTLRRAQQEFGFARRTLLGYLQNYATDESPQLTPVHDAVVRKLFDGPSSGTGGRPVTIALLADEVIALAAQRKSGGRMRRSAATVPEAADGAGDDAEAIELRLRVELADARADARRWENLFRIEQAARIFQDERARDQLSQFTGPVDAEDLTPSPREALRTKEPKES